jgi:hypothetical protein
MSILQMELAHSQARSLIWQVMAWRPVALSGERGYIPYQAQRFCAEGKQQ